jgi:hypothetical protein
VPVPTRAPAHRASSAIVRLGESPLIRSGEGEMPTIPVRRVAASCAYVASVLALAYSVTFAIVVKEGSRWASWTSTTVLAVGGLVALPVIVVIFQRVRVVDEGFALVALLLGTASAIGSTLHGVHDLAVLFNPPTSAVELPNATDARGFATFGLFALSIALSSWLLVRTGLPHRFATLGYAASVSLLVVYIGRLTVLDPNTTWIAVAAVASGFVAVPLWYAWLARALVTEPADPLGAPLARDPRPAIGR